ncbi:MAG: 5'-methylthioadenosine/adenosylhomocysteine nucleosidase [Oscillospiraceae bacterium]|nr:5'-methylthioadenosine/adenosylhomocysteine nucleosidase [Oscillospiraceae bacterium]
MKNRLSLFLAAVLLLVSAGFFAAPVYAESPEESRLGIISAMDNEIALLLGEMELERVDTIGGVDYSVGTLHGQSVVIMRSGIGKVRAASAVTVLLNQYPVSSVIFTGIAGGVGSETQILDQVIGTRLVQHDYGTLTNDGFVWSSAVSGEEVEGDGYYESDPGLVELASAAAESVLGADHVFLGTIATGDQFIASGDYVLKLQRDFDAIACEMEGASVAAVCTQYGIPFVVLRAMSDKADGNATQSASNFGDQAAENSSRIVLRMLDDLQVGK